MGLPLGFLQVGTDPEDPDGPLLVAGMGELHLEVAAARLLTERKLEVLPCAPLRWNLPNSGRLGAPFSGSARVFERRTVREPCQGARP